LLTDKNGVDFAVDDSGADIGHNMFWEDGK